MPDTQGSSAPSPSELHVFFRWRGSPSRSLLTAQRRSVRRAHSDDSPLLVSHALSLDRPPFVRPPNNVKISQACLLKCKPIVDCSCEKPFAVRSRSVRSSQPFGFAVHSRSFRCSQPLGPLGSIRLHSAPLGPTRTPLGSLASGSRPRRSTARSGPHQADVNRSRANASSWRGSPWASQ